MFNFPPPPNVPAAGGERPSMPVGGSPEPLGAPMEKEAMPQQEEQGTDTLKQNIFLLFDKLEQVISRRGLSLVDLFQEWAERRK